ncbi:MAG: hypothetical protein GWM92_07070 [Gemmatimonadetes bacterium]|nr:hypothetical protein [Gemmatimonadota bacterium]NIR78383.1 hypothetical protein [Gemmatimonadota bacterium]NIT86987.1 hypothetical protein [Gemmatimonadota bacterium]NIU30831.1 hypothetical protein [Gemmatimonadota bacterium]NIU35605.1 hypothetical protein [Gemmatimonadota bacterium]
MTEKSCPACGESLSWRNAGVRCRECGREYCKECPDYRGGRLTVKCPECGSRTAELLR